MEPAGFLRENVCDFDAEDLEVEGLEAEDLEAKDLEAELLEAVLLEAPALEAGLRLCEEEGDDVLREGDCPLSEYLLSVLRERFRADIYPQTPQHSYRNTVIVTNREKV